MNSTLTKDQKKTFTKYFKEDGQEYEITATARYDDECGNGHNSFGLTAEIWATKNKRRTRRDCELCGCLHEDIAKHFPELEPFIKWHLVSSDEPLHYIANTLYHFEQGKIDSAMDSCVWGVAPQDSMMSFTHLNRKKLELYLIERLPHVQMAFKKAMEGLGFTF